MYGLGASITAPKPAYSTTNWTTEICQMDARVATVTVTTTAPTASFAALTASATTILRAATAQRVSYRAIARMAAVPQTLSASMASAKLR